MKALFIALLAIVIVSCNSKSGQKLKEKELITVAEKPADTIYTRARILENRTIVIAKLTRLQAQYYRAADTVWLNLATYMIDDTSDYTMKAVILLR
jgi:ribosomal protein S8E